MSAETERLVEASPRQPSVRQHGANRTLPGAPRGGVADVIANTEAVILIGASADQLAEELRAHPKVVRAQTMEEAVSVADGLARQGGVVLLSPAYKSFDMFKDFEDRGNQFKELVRRRFAA